MKKLNIYIIVLLTIPLNLVAFQHSLSNYLPFASIGLGTAEIRTSNNILDQLGTPSFESNSLNAVPFFARSALNTMANWASKNKKSLLGIGTVGAVAAGLWAYPTSRKFIQKAYQSFFDGKPPQGPPAPAPEAPSAAAVVPRLREADVLDIHLARLSPPEQQEPIERLMTYEPARQTSTIVRPRPEIPTRPAPKRPRILQHVINPSHIAPPEAMQQQSEFKEIERPEIPLVEAITLNYNLDAPRFKAPPIQQEQVAIYYHHGKDLFHELCNRKKNQLTIENVRNLMWFLYLQAVAQESKAPHYNIFEDVTYHFYGSPTEISYFYNLLKGVPEKYPRAASHFPEFLEMGNHYGIDITKLPQHRTTILFSKLNDNEMYIKPEPHGVKTIQDTLLHGLGYIESQARKKLPDFVKPALNAAGFDMRSDDDPAFRKEHTPPYVLHATELLICSIEPDINTQNQHITQIKKFGIRKIIPLLIQYQEKYPANTELGQKIATHLQFLTTKYPDWKYRKGNEITFSLQTLCDAPAVI